MKNYEGYDDAQLRTRQTKNTFGDTHQHMMAFMFLCVVIALIGFGLVCMYSASYDEALRIGKNGSYFFLRQFVFAILGLTVFTVLQFIPMRLIKLSIWMALVVSFVLKLLTLITPLGVTRLGSRRWIEIPFLPSFQPSELLKLVTILALAYWFSSDRFKQYRLLYILVPVSVVLFGALLIIAQKDYSTTLLYVGIAMAMLIVVGILFSWILLFIIAIGIPAIIFLLIEPYRIKRLTGFLFPDIDPTGINWQVNNSLKAMASGGLWGKGIGKGEYKLGSLPEVQNDFIFANIVEEMVIIGILLVLTLFFLFAFIGFRTYRNLLPSRKFEAYATFGLTCSIIWQALGNIAVVTGIFPPTGITLPFFSQGGTSLLVVIFESAMMYKMMQPAKENVMKRSYDG